jgi:hypothetical protein
MNEEAERQPKWCGRCQKFHLWLPPFDEQKMVDLMAQEMADIIDEDVYQTLLRTYAIRKTDP